MSTYGVDLVLVVRLVSEANMHEHWRRRAARRKAHRTIAKIEVGNLLNKMRKVGLATAPSIRVNLVRIAPNFLDDDNLPVAFKAIRDGIADAVGLDDRSDRYRWTYDQRKPDDRKNEHAVLVEMRWEGP